MVDAGGPSPEAALAGLKIVEFAQLIAGPMAGSFLADLGAEVVHVEEPTNGDALRVSGAAKDGHHLWWKVSARNKRCVTLDLRQTEGQEIARDLVRWADVVITNFRPPALRRWGMTYDELHKVNPKLIMLQVSGFGASSSRADEPGFGKVGEAMSGVVEITGFPDGPPLHTGFSHADSLTGLMGAVSIQAALYRRSADPNFDGEWIDLALYETLFRLVEWQVIVHDQAGLTPTRHGNRLAISPAAVINMYRSRDGDWVTVTSGTPRSVRKVAALLGEPAQDYSTADQQAERSERLDALLREWIGARDVDETLEAMAEVGVVASRIYTMDDIVKDQTYIERGNVIAIDDEDLGEVRMQNVVPRLASHAGGVWRTGPHLGADNDHVYHGILGIEKARLEKLQAMSVI